MPKGAKSAKTCTLDMLKQDGSVPQMSFFKAKHMKGFWPFTVNTEEEEIELAVSVLSTCFQRNFFIAGWWWINSFPFCVLTAL